jgi:AcrR family transcriptional regulator
MATARLSRDARRAQLLDVAYDVIKREGTDALTLARVAEEAGVSKPIAYDHFGSRAGLLAALFRSIDEQQVEAMRAALAAGGDTLRATAEIAAAGYLDCLTGPGPEWEQLCAALLAYDETKGALDESRAFFAEAYREAFAPFVALDGARGRAVLAGLVGAAEALARERHEGRIARRTAIDALTEILHATLAPLAHAR